VKLLHLVGFIIKKFVTMQHGHVNVKLQITVYIISATCLAIVRHLQGDDDDVNTE